MAKKRKTTTDRKIARRKIANKRAEPTAAEAIMDANASGITPVLVPFNDWSEPKQTLDANAPDFHNPRPGESWSEWHQRTHTLEALQRYGRL